MLQFSRSSCLIGDEKKKEGLNDLWLPNIQILFISIVFNHTINIHPNTVYIIYHTPTNILPKEVPYAFKNSMSHRVLQFALLIALSCVLHRFKSQDIHRNEFYLTNQPPTFSQINQNCCNTTQTLPYYNDPSAGSPTETLLRLHLPLNDKIYTTSPRYSNVSENPKCSPDHSIGRCDGRCVQRAGT